MSDPTKVYTGAIPQGGYDSMQVLNTSNEAESGYVPGKAESFSPKVVNQGGNTQPKTYDQNKSQDFLLDSTYKTDMEVAPRPTKMDIDNPDKISNADHCDDEDVPNKGY